MGEKQRRSSTRAGSGQANRKGSGEQTGNAAPSEERGDAPDSQKKQQQKRATAKDPQPRKGIQGVRGGPSPVGSKNPERRCTATANRTGERCKAPAILGGTVCRMHGGNLPQVKNKAKERLLALVDPALAALHQVLTSKDADDATKVRAALGILDRTGFKPGMTIEVGVNKFDQVVSEAIKSEDLQIDRSAMRPAARPTGGGGDHSWEDVDTFAKDAQQQSWSAYDDEDLEPYRTRMNPFDGNTVKGEVVGESGQHVDPPRYYPEEPPRAR